MTEQTNPIEVEATPTQAVAIRQDQAVVNPLDLDPAMFKAGLDRRKENRKLLIDWVKSALVEGTDFGRIPTKRGPSKPSLWKPGAEKICGMLGVTPTFPTLKDYEQAALNGTKIKSIVMRCEITNSSGAIIAHGVGGRDLEQDYGDLNKALKMAEKSAHIDATLRMAGLSEIFTQDIEDMKVEPQPQAVPKQGSKPKTDVKAPSSPVAASKPRSATAATRTWFAEQVKAADAVEEALQFMIELGWLMPNEGMADVPLRFVPNTKGEGSKLDLFFKHMRAWIGGGEALAPYEPDWDAEPGKKPVEVPREESEPGQTSAAALEPWYNFIVPIPQKGMKRDEYIKHPDTIGSLYEARHGDDEESQAKRQRLWGFLNHFEPKPYKGKISDTDVKFREMLDTFGEWFEKNHPEEKI